MFFFSHRSKRRMHFFGGFSRVDSTIKVQIPESVMQAELSTTNGGIRISEISKPEMVKAHTTNGGITCNDVRASHVELISSNASVKCEDTKVQTICMESTNGALRLKDVQADEKLVAHTTNGSIHFEEIDAKDIQLKTSNASFKGRFYVARVQSMQLKVEPAMVRILCHPNGIRVIRLRNACQFIPAMPTLR